MPTSIETTARHRMRTILETILPSTQVVLGLDDIGASDPNFFDNLVSCGPKAYILGALVDNLDAVNRLYTFNVVVKVHFAVTPDGDYTYEAINDLMKEIFEALVTKASYTDCLPPTSLGYNKESVVAHKGAIAGPVGVYVMKFVFIAGSDCL